MTIITKGITITGTILADEPLQIAGTVVGDVVSADHEVILEPGARVEGSVLARSIVVRGASAGRLAAREIVRMQTGARVRADIAAPRIALEEGAVFNGRVEPARTEAAFRVADYRAKGAPTAQAAGAARA
ncbi:MAG TPA: polymer-forming cytoskeletal protein [Vicinamibacterales bacterium]|nr:polymer-forming cytoskeletal protein [Vicinamibacterales bacterium]